MELVKILIFTALIILAMVFFIITMAAYSYRRDRSFWGGANILNGWWLLFPYGSDGVEPEAKNIVFWGRIVFSAILACGALLRWGV